MKSFLERDIEKLQRLLAAQAQAVIGQAVNTLRLFQGSTSNPQPVATFSNSYISLNEFCSRLICLQAPKASDLRLVLGALRINESLRTIELHTQSIGRRHQHQGSRPCGKILNLSFCP